MLEELTPDRLRRCYQPAELGFATTNDLPDIEASLGQPRAEAALRLGADMAGAGYNVFAHGVPGTPKRAVAVALLGARAAQRPVPPDLCYVQNFDEPHKPRLLMLPPGHGAALRHDMDAVIEELRPALTAAFEGDDYRRRREAIDAEIEARHRPALAELTERAQREGLALVQSPAGLGFVPAQGDAPMSEEEFRKLPDEERERLHERSHAFQADLEVVLRKVPGWARERRQRLRDLDLDVVRQAVGHLLEEVRKQHDAVPQVVAHLEAVERDLIENARQLLEPEIEVPAELGDTLHLSAAGRSRFRRYQVNLLVDNGATTGSPVVFEDNPSYENLFGRVDAVSRLGNLVTDFTLIRPGALHRANGGYLIVDALRVLRAPFAWEALKLALESQRVRIESLARHLGVGAPIALEPEPLALDLRVVLLGEPVLYYLLSDLDPDFRELFKLVADFDDQLEANADGRSRYVRLVATLARQRMLLPFDASAVALLLEESTRQSGAQDRLSLRTDRLTDTMVEADQLARASGVDCVSAGQVQTAIDAQIHRVDRLRDRLAENTRRGVILVDTTGATIGQANGLSLIELGEFAFGRPSRITARVRVGPGKVVDIEREVELGGPIHTKGVLILSAFLAGRYALETPLSLHASLVFEQSYAPVEGDSASAAELCALLSAIAGVPLKQSIAITGAVNQRGEIQAVGGVNEKVEAFFDTCRCSGLTGDQGVLIPRANVQHLMLRREIVAAVAQGQFHVLAMQTVDDAIEPLMGMPAGERGEAGGYPAGTFNQLVELRLQDFAARRREFDSHARAGGLNGEPAGSFRLT